MCHICYNYNDCTNDYYRIGLIIYIHNSRIFCGHLPYCRKAAAVCAEYDLFGKLGLIINLDNRQKHRILIVDDSQMNRSILADMLDNEYEIIEAEDGTEAVAVLQQHALDISLVLLDVMMPRMDGFEVLTVMNQRHWIDDIPVIIISAESDSSQVERAYELGVTDFITRPFDTLIVRHRVVNTILLYTKQKKLIGMLADQIYEKERQSSFMVDILSHIVEFRNGESGLHIVQVRKLTEVLLHQLQRMTDKYHLSHTDISLICTASALHDIGKIAINEAVLNKPGRLTAEEFEIIKTHSAIGADMLKNLSAYQNEPLIKTAYEICRWHHERYDGRGYPDGLVGDEIPISAQIVALADVYDALISDRCYKKAYSHETAVQMILDGQCGAFNPLLLECLREMSPYLREELANAVVKKHRFDMQPLLKNIDNKDLLASERSLRLMDYERMKYNFFAAMTEEIQFEYTVAASTLTLSGWGAKKLGLDEVIMNPEQNEKVNRIFGVETWGRLSKLLRATTPERPVITYELKLNLDNQIRWHRIIAQAMWSADDEPHFIGTIGKCVDIHDSRMKLEELEERASHDTLTGLLNRATVKELIQNRIQNNPSRTYVLAILDLDQFKAANDSYGHMFGDKVLKHMAKKLLQNTSGDDIVARVGGDEFLLFLEYKTDAEQVVKRIFDAVTGSFEDFTLTATIGAVRTSVMGKEYDTLFHAADQALYSAKRAGRRQYRFYDDSMHNMLSAISSVDRGVKGE